MDGVSTTGGVIIYDGFQWLSGDELGGLRMFGARSNCLDDWDIGGWDCIDTNQSMGINMTDDTT
jgi:hypothetical protein